MNRAHEAVQVGAALQTKLYDVRLMSNSNTLSKKIIGHELLSEFKSPGKSTGKIFNEIEGQGQMFCLC